MRSWTPLSGSGAFSWRCPGVLRKASATPGYWRAAFQAESEDGSRRVCLLVNGYGLGGLFVSDFDLVFVSFLRPQRHAMRRVGIAAFVRNDSCVDGDGGSGGDAGGEALGDGGFGVGHAGLGLAEGDEDAAAAEVLADGVEGEAPAGRGELGEQDVLGAGGVGGDGDGGEGRFDGVG